MKPFYFSQLLSLVRPASYSTGFEDMIFSHQHDQSEGSEFLDETVHMHEQPFEGAEQGNQ